MQTPTLRSNLIVLWLRLTALSIVALAFSEALFLAQGRAQGWSFYLTAPEVGFEVIVRLIAASLAGILLGTVCTAVLFPFFWYFKSHRERILEGATRVGVILVLFVVSRYALEVLIKWSYTWWSHPALYDKVLLTLQFVVFAVALCVARTRRALVHSFDDLLTPKMTRRTAVATVVGTAALVATEFALSRRFSSALVVTSRRPKSNILLISFDALTAEDMSLYGRQLPTTPNIDAFAKTSTVFTQFYSGSTFTTPCIGVMMTGGYPSDTFVYGLSGQVPASRADQNIARVLREAGYKTAAFLTNPWAYYLARSLKPGFDLLPDPKFHPGGMQDLWTATTPLHQNSGLGSRIDEYFDLEQLWNAIAGHPTSLAFRYRPGATMREAQQLLQDLPDGFFLWVHGMPPHHPYLPSKPEQGRFLPQQEVQSFRDEPWTHWKPHYPPDQQGAVDRHRLAYDEFICSTDRRFGDLIANLERSGRLENTTIILSADHGESFEGGIYQHQTPYLTRPVIHVPLIIRTPGQNEGRRVDVAADQTCLAPTIVDLAGMPKPAWMRGQSLVPFLNGDRASTAPRHLAFSQYLERNSIFKPLRKGTLGVIDGEFQYVVYLDSQRGELRPLTEAQYWNIDRSAEFPEKVESLRAALQARFPGLVT